MLQPVELPIDQVLVGAAKLGGQTVIFGQQHTAQTDQITVDGLLNKADVMRQQVFGIAALEIRERLFHQV